MLLRENKFLGKYLSLGWVSCIGDALYYIALMTYAATLENPSLGILIIVISTTFPTLIQVILGALADTTKAKTIRIIQSGIFRGIVFIIIAFIIMNSTSLAGIIVIGVLNALSDTAGTFSALLKSPFIRLMVRSEQLEETIGLDQAVRQSIDGIAGFFGVLLLGFLGIYYLAFFNALIFFSVSFGFKMLQEGFRKIEEQIEPPKVTCMKDFSGHIKHSVKTLVGVKPLRNFFLMVAASNAILAPAIPVFLMALAENEAAQIINFEFSVTFSKGVILVVAILAGIIGPKYCKGIGTTMSMFMSMFSAMLFMIAIGYGAIWLGLGLLLANAFSATMLSIRLSSLLMQSVPPETLGTISGAIGLFLSVLPIPLTIALNSIAAISLSTFAIVGSVLSVIVIIIIFAMKLDKMDLKSAMEQYGINA